MNPLFTVPPAAPPAPRGQARPWWENRVTVGLFVVLAMLPLVAPPFPPLTDLPGHMGRYAVAMGDRPLLEPFFDYRWLPIGNLGVDLVVHALGRGLGLDVEVATKLVVMLIPALTVAGLLWVAREVHNRLPPTILFAVPLAYSYPFLFGFVNFALSMALALLAFGLWLRLARLGALTTRALLAVPISVILFFTHVFGWGTLGLLAFSAEAVRQHDKGLSYWRAGLRAVPHALSLALPALLMLAWRRDANGGDTGGWFRWDYKWDAVAGLLKDRWPLFDQASVLVLLIVVLFAALHRKLTLSRNLMFSALVLTLVFLLLPRLVFGSAYADMRMVPFAVMLWIVSIRFRAETDLALARPLALAALGFALVRLGGNAVSLGIAGAEQRVQLATLDALPRGSRLAALIHVDCARWAQQRNNHLGSMAIVRRDSFANDQWAQPGSSLLSVALPGAAPFAYDPSQMLARPGCRFYSRPLAERLRTVPDVFDHLWLVDLPPGLDTAVNPARWQRIAAAPGAILYRRAAP